MAEPFILDYTGAQINEAMGKVLNGEVGGNSHIEYIESVSGEDKVCLRNLETGVYIINGYAEPYEGSSHTLIFNNALTHVARKDAGSHVMVFSPLNAIINFLEILVDDTAEKGYTYTRTNIELLDIQAAINELAGKVANLSGNSRVAEVTLTANGWVGNASPYSQVVTVADITENSQVDLTPSVEQLAIFYNKSLAFVAENDGGIVTVYAIGQKPENDYTIQVTITEVSV